MTIKNYRSSEVFDKKSLKEGDYISFYIMKALINPKTVNPCVAYIKEAV